MNKLITACLLLTGASIQAFGQSDIFLGEKAYRLIEGRAFHVGERGQLMEVIPTRLIVKPINAKGFSSEFLQQRGFPGLKVISKVLPGGFMIVDVDPSLFKGAIEDAFRLANFLNQKGWVEFIDFDGKIESVETEVDASASLGFYYDCVPNDPIRSWHLGRINMYAAWCHARPAPWVTIAVIDSSFLLSHEEFETLTITNPFNFAQNNTNVFPQGFHDDTSNIHGTRTLGVLAAMADNASGISGVAGRWQGDHVSYSPKIMPLKIAAGYSELALALDYARTHGADVINYSGGLQQDKPVIMAVITALEDEGIVVVASAGNSKTYIDYPANYPSVIAAGSMGKGDVYTGDAYLSSTKTLDVVAPDKVTTTEAVPVNGQYFATDRYVSNWDGTSASAPQVAGVVALMISENPGLTPAQVRTIIHTTAEYLGPKLGHGVLNAEQCVLYARELR